MIRLIHSSFPHGSPLSSRAIRTKGSIVRTTTIISRETIHSCDNIHRPSRSTCLLLPRHQHRRITSSSSLLANKIVPFHLHDIGEGITEVEILKWHVKEGDTVEEFDNLCEVQSDKSVVELTSPTAGAVHKLKFDEGQVVAVGQVLCDIFTGDEGEGDQTSSDLLLNAETSSISDSASPDARNDEKVRTSSDDDAHSPPSFHTDVVESTRQTPLPQEDQNKTTREDHENYANLLENSDLAMDSAGTSRFSGEGGILPSAPPSNDQAQLDNNVVPERRVSPSNHTPRISGKRVLASPAVRTRAHQLGVDITSVVGTGEGGRILKTDLESVAGVFGGNESGDRGDTTGSIGKDRESIPANTRVEFGRTRKVMWKAMGSMGSVPHFGYTHTLNLTNLVPIMKSLNTPSNAPPQSYRASDIPSSLVVGHQNDHQRSVKRTSILSILVKTMLLALEEHPIMRARVKESQGDRWLDIARDGLIGIAVSDQKYGLLTPSLPPIKPSTPLTDITHHLTTLRQSPTKPTTSPNITISSIGALGESVGAMPVLPPGGGVAICAVGRARWEMEWKFRDGSGSSGEDGGKKRGGVWDIDPLEVVQGGVQSVLRCSVGWSGDHRVLEGAELIAFTETWKRYIEEPWRWIKID